MHISQKTTPYRPQSNGQHSAASSLAIRQHNILQETSIQALWDVTLKYYVMRLVFSVIFLRFIPKYWFKKRTVKTSILSVAFGLSLCFFFLLHNNKSPLYIYYISKYQSCLAGMLCWQLWLSYMVSGNNSEKILKILNKKIGF